MVCLRSCDPRPVHASHKLKTSLKTVSVCSRGCRSPCRMEEGIQNGVGSVLRMNICKWFLNLGMIFGWVWTICQWNLMARCISIGPLGLHHFGFAEDSITVMHDSTKADKAGENLTKKHVCTNPKDPSSLPCCCAAVVFLGIHQKSFENSEKMFRSDTAQRRIAST